MLTSSRAGMPTPVAWRRRRVEGVDAVPNGPAMPYPPPVGVHLPLPPAPPEDEGLRRISPQQVLLAAGAVAIVVAGAASSSLTGWVFPAVLALGMAAASVRSGHRGLRSSEETLAIAAVALAVVSDRADTGELSATVLAVLAAVYWLLGRLSRTAVAWPVAGWLTAQLAVLVALSGTRADDVPSVSAVLATAVAGLLVTLRARPAVAVGGLRSEGRRGGEE